MGHDPVHGEPDVRAGHVSSTSAGVKLRAPQRGRMATVRAGARRPARYVKPCQKGPGLARHWPQSNGAALAAKYQWQGSWISLLTRRANGAYRRMQHTLE